MKTWYGLTPLFLLLLSFSNPAQTIEGTWAGAIESHDFLAALRLDISSDGKDAKLTMLYAGDRRGGAIENLRVLGQVVTFDAKMQPGARFRGTISGSSISGSFDMLNRAGAVQSTGEWDARKVDSEAIAGPMAAPPGVVDDNVDLPRPGGKYGIARRHFYWTDESRKEEITDEPDDKRKIFAQLWYPAAKADKLPDAEYFPHMEEFRAKHGSLPAIKRMRTHAKMDAPIAREKGKFPIVIFSPGLGGSSFTNTALVEHFVSHGYVVAVIAHPYDTEGFRFHDGVIVRYAATKWNREAPKDWTPDERITFMDERRYGWADDVLFVVEKLRASDVARHIDFSSLGHAGYSFGGQASSIVCASDTRFKACANLDGMAQGRAILGTKGNTTLKQPFLFFTKAPELTDYELTLTGLTREQYRERDRHRLLTKWKPSFKQQMATIEAGSYLIVYPGAKHSSFSDSPLIDFESGQPYADRLKTVVTVAEYTRSFFDKYLRKMPAPLLERPNSARNGLMIEFLKK